MEHTIDAQGKSLGRVASAAAKLLLGKDKPTFERHKITGGRVTIVNAGKASITEKKLKETLYQNYSGYPGGFYYRTMGEVAKRKGYSELFRIAVLGMLPKNKLQSRLIKKLTVKE